VSCYTRSRKGAAILLSRGGELGSTQSYLQLGIEYHTGDIVEKDVKKARHFYELAAIGGNVNARQGLVGIEMTLGNINKAIKHSFIAAGFGHARSLKTLQKCLKAGHATRDDYENALRAYQEYIEAVRSDQRDEAVAFNHDYQYLIEA
jgi:TPR repeat protein